MNNYKPFEVMLTGGHPNSLGRTAEVVEMILADQTRLPELFDCYQSTDEVVRLRTSSAFKRIWREQPTWVTPYIDRFINEVTQLHQPSADWTMAQMFDELSDDLTPAQRTQAQEILQRYLTTHHDWIVLNHSMQTLANWSQDDEALRIWLLSQLERLTNETRKSVARRAEKLLKQLR